MGLCCCCQSERPERQTTRRSVSDSFRRKCIARFKGMDGQFRPGGPISAPCTKVELSVSCRNLLNMDILTKSDPMCVLFVKEFGRDNWYEFGRTEVIDNNLNPEFAKKFVLDYYFEERQMIRFEVYDIDNASTDLKSHDFLGRVEAALGEIVSVSRFERSLTGTTVKNTGIISVVAAEEIATCKEEVTFQFAAKKLDKKDWFGKSDPFLAIYKTNDDGSHSVVHRTEVIKCTLNPTWTTFTLPVRSLCAGDYARPILIRCFDWNRNTTEELIGECMTNLQSLSQATQGMAFFELINPTMRSKHGYKSSGALILASIKIQIVPTFLDYVLAGTQLNCTIAIDFTASNGDPTKSESLHYIHPYYPNQYQRALTSVGEIIQDYDSDKLFPVLGFGARLPPDGRVAHEFFVNGHPNNPFCHGIAGVVDAYQRCLRGVQLYGPTNFSPIINHVARFAAAKKDGSEYFILLIITDGAITDMEKTKEAIVNASSLPLSIIIVGVGDADFEAMRELDGDAVKLSWVGRYAQRDIVQFVPFREFIKGQNQADLQVAQAQLAKEVLAEIPEQFTSYMKKNNILPGSWPQQIRQQPAGPPPNPAISIFAPVAPRNPIPTHQSIPPPPPSAPHEPTPPPPPYPGHAPPQVNPYPPPTGVYPTAPPPYVR